MNFVKPTVRVALVRQVSITLHGTSEEIGPSYWKATAYLTTREGQGVCKSFMGIEKEDALGKAYYFLKMCMKHNTLTLATAERLETESNKSLSEREHDRRAEQAYQDYVSEKITVDVYLKLKEMDFPEAGYIEVPVPEPGPKWKWYYWFYNPNN